jgi:transcriptional regulator with XRE-family HTH domain
LYLLTDNARAEMQARGLSQRQWADLAGVHRITVCKALNGRPMTFQTAYRLAQALDRVPKLPLHSLERITVPVKPTKRSRNGR